VNSLPRLSDIDVEYKEENEYRLVEIHLAHMEVNYTKGDRCTSSRSDYCTDAGAGYREFGWLHKRILIVVSGLYSIVTH
jgi:hypothetical protein